MTVLCKCGCGEYVKTNGSIFCKGHYLRLNPLRKGYPRPSTSERFWKNVDKSGDCWIWNGCITGNGYGTIRHNGKPEGTHRVAWILANGDIPKGMMVMHSCDNPLCVRINHLSLGSLQENIQDMVKKGRASRKGPGNPARGERNAGAVLTEMDVVRIRHYHSEGLNPQELAKRYNVTDVSIRNILNGKTWKHVEG